ncbi:MAG TPA: alpha/beta hydrolase [Allosphingosinicella sp.]|nr:alpha/beta hydrolase [Allosphingosinicella sp.]
MTSKSRNLRSEGQRSASDGRLWKWGAAAAGSALAASAVVNHRRARQAEQDNPPLGEFLEVGGVTLHYVERGAGAPLLLLHGNGTMVEDWQASGLLDALAADHRVIAVDRPGFGHSGRPRSTVWTPAAQAALIAQALDRLGIERPLVVGHSFGTLVALALALDNPGKLSGLVLLGGYYYPSARADVVLASPPALPLVGDVIRYTVSPLLGTALQPKIARKMFAPAPVPERFAGFPMAMALRPWQIRAEAAEAALMVPAAAALARRYGELALPVTIVAGRGDEVVDPIAQSARLHDELSGSRFELIDGAGHMIHYTALPRVTRLIGEAAAR